MTESAKIIPFNRTGIMGRRVADRLLQERFDRVVDRIVWLALDEGEYLADDDEAFAHARRLIDAARYKVDAKGWPEGGAA
jgi:hypothetical protein